MKDPNNYLIHEEIQGDLFFTSDPHFGHKNIIKYANRPFKNIKEHDKALIENWNDVVTDNDTVICQGDFSLTKDDYTREIMGKLHGKKILIRGNHDQSHAKMLSFGFYRSVPNLIFGQFYMVHNPNNIGLKTHKNSRKIILAGHTHQKQKIIRINDRPIINMCCDAWEFRPVKMSELKEYCRKWYCIL